MSVPDRLTRGLKADGANTVILNDAIPGYRGWQGWHPLWDDRYCKNATPSDKFSFTTLVKGGKFNWHPWQDEKGVSTTDTLVLIVNAIKGVGETPSPYFIDERVLSLWVTLAARVGIEFLPLAPWWWWKGIVFNTNLNQGGRKIILPTNGDRDAGEVEAFSSGQTDYHWRQT